MADQDDFGGLDGAGVFGGFDEFGEFGKEGDGLGGLGDVTGFSGEEWLVWGFERWEVGLGEQVAGLMEMREMHMGVTYFCDLPVPMRS